MKRNVSLIAAAACVLVLIFMARETYAAFPAYDLTEEDIYYAFVEGERITKGNNPYARIPREDMRNNDKYATYFPLFYEASALSISFGLESFDEWIQFWEPVFRFFNYTVALLLLVIFARSRLEWGGVAAAGFWLFSRWNLYIIASANLEFIPIFFMLAAFALYPKKKYTALFLFSLSLAFKQLGIFVAPLFVIWAYTAEEDWKTGLIMAVKSSAVIASIPFVASLPFLIWNLEGFVRSIAFSATRFPDTHIPLDSIDAMLGWEGPLARIPMGIMLLAVYWMAAKKIGGKYLPAALAFTVFISFNAVLFNQYFIWLAGLLSLVVLDFTSRRLDGKQPSEY